MNPNTCARRSCRRITTRPRLSAPLTANTLFAKSIPIVVTSISDPPRFSDVAHTSLAHCEAVYSGRGPYHQSSIFGIPGEMGEVPARVGLPKYFRDTGESA